MQDAYVLHCRLRLLLERTVQELVDDPFMVRVQMDYCGGGKLRYFICVDPADHRFVVGKEGRTVDALRLLIAAALKGDQALIIVRRGE